MSEPLPFSQACENNKDYILEVLERHLLSPSQVLEIGSGTGQHAVYFAGRLAFITWQSSDMQEYVESLNRRILLAGLDNLPEAIPLNVSHEDWECGHPDHIFSANSLHIMSETCVRDFFLGIKRHLATGGCLFVYGPFKYHGEFTSPSNANFDLWLKSRDPLSGVRDFETVDSYAREAGLVLIEDNAMPANNQLLVWQKTSAVD